MYALVSGHDFYVNCERLIKPSLKGRPVVVLGYNSGSTIARSNEARALGIRMGTPWSRLKHMEYDNGLVVLSANYGLYGDMSSRFMPLAASLAREQEIYSIDECFIGLHAVPDTNERACSLSARIKQYTGIPCSIGIGQTRTLAKLANYIAQAAERRPDKYPIDLASVRPFRPARLRLRSSAGHYLGASRLGYQPKAHRATAPSKRTYRARPRPHGPLRGTSTLWCDARTHGV